MAVDLTAYDLVDAELEDYEQQTVLLRLLQSQPEGLFVSEEDAARVMQWVLAFQEARGHMALLLKGRASVTVVGDGLRFEAHLADPHPDLTELPDDDRHPPECPEGRPDPDPFPWQ